MASPQAVEKQSTAYYEHASASLLARQPMEAPQPAVTQSSMDWVKARSHLEARLNMLRNWRLSWAQHWALLAAYILPRRNTWLTMGAGIGGMPVPNSMIRGLPINQNIVDPTGTQAMRVCTSGLMSGLMSPTRPWFKVAPSVNGLENNPDVQAWCEHVEDLIYTVMAGSNFYESGAQMFEDLVVFGTAPMIIYEDDEDLIRCYNPCAGEYYLAASNANRVESLYRQFTFTVAQIVEMFGLENCPADVQGLWSSRGSSLEVERIVAHAIEPNFPMGQGDVEVELISSEFPYREVYWLWGASDVRPLSVRGFFEPPFIAPRWAVTSNDAYGRSCGMDCLPDIMQLQVETRRKAEAIEKLVRPPLLASVDLKNQPSSILPGHVTYVANLGPNTGMRPIYEVRPEIQEMMTDLMAVQQRVKAGFFNDLFLMLAQMEGVQPRNDMEIAERRSEKLQVLGPVMERFQNEAASPAIKRIFSILARKRMLPPAPQVLQGTQLQIEYVSMLSIAQKASQTAAMEKFAAVNGNLAAVYPEARAVLDPIEFLKEYGALLNVPMKIMHSPDEIQQIIQQQEQQMQTAQGVQLGTAAAQGAQTLSQTPVGGGNTALDMLLGGQMGGGGGAAPPPQAPAGR